MNMAAIREMSSQVVGFFYPSDEAHLRRVIDTYLREVDEVSISGSLKAVLVPHAGYVYSGPVAARGYRLIRNLDQKKSWRVFVIGVSHFVPFTGICIGAYEQYSTPLGPVIVSPLAGELVKAGANFIPEAHRHEHSIEVQMPFLKYSLKHFEMVPILTSNTDHEKLADMIEPYMDDSTILIVSSDLSHMRSYDRARELDNKLLKWVVDGDEKSVRKHGEACCMQGLLAMISLSRRLNWKRELIMYASSGDTHGDRTQVVGYGCVACYA
jgi:AmmeMemoRadiSam system protein B